MCVEQRIIDLYVSFPYFLFPTSLFPPLLFPLSSSSSPSPPPPPPVLHLLVFEDQRHQSWCISSFPLAEGTLSLRVVFWEELLQLDSGKEEGRRGEEEEREGGRE